MQRFARLTDDAKKSLLAGDADRLSRLIAENLDPRRSICHLQPAHVRIAETARQSGVSAKFAGAGGAIIGTYLDETIYLRLKGDLEAIGCRVLKPVIV